MARVLQQRWRGLWFAGFAGVETAVLVAGLGLALRGGRQLIFRSVEDGATTGDVNARVVAVWESELGGRHLLFRISRKATGPGRLNGNAKFILDQDIERRSRHVRWKAKFGLNTSDQAAVHHEFCARVVQSAVVFDQLCVSVLACVKAGLQEHADVRVSPSRTHPSWARQ